jgi:phage-related protein
MYEIIFYRMSNGKEPVYDYIKELKNKSDKDSRIKLNKINDYIQALSIYGASQLTGNYAKHLSSDIWELRPMRDRILFVYDGERYVLLHRFMKQTQKTPVYEIEKAKREYIDYLIRRDNNG